MISRNGSAPELVGDVIFKRPFADRLLHEADARREYVACDPEDTHTVQSAKDDADINVIVARFSRSGELPIVPFPAEYGDFSQVGSFHEAQNQIREASEAFMELPPKLRERFKNSPAELLSAIEASGEDPKLASELVELGVLAPKEAPPAAPAPAAPPAPPAGS